MTKLNVSFIQIDFALQTILVIMNSLFLLFLTISNGYEIYIYFLLFQFFIGFYQYLMSALPNMFIKYVGKIKIYRQIHFYSSTIILVFIFSFLPFIFDIISFIIFCTILPQILMWFYYYITYSNIQRNEF